MKRIHSIFWVVILAFCWCFSVVAQTPQQLREVTSTEGREFFVGWLLNGESALTPAIDPNLKLNLYVSSRVNNTIVVETVGGSTTYTVAAGATETIDIDPNIAYVDKGSDQTEKVQRKGVRVYSQTDQLFTLFASNKNGVTQDGTASFDATQIIPVEGLGSEYIIHTHELDRFANQFMIVGTEDGTDVTIQLSADSKSFQAGNAYPTIHLNAKEVYLVTSSKQSADFSGTTICATQPVAVFNGSTSVLIPNQNGMTDDHAYEQAMPVNKWGKRFVVPMTANYTSANMLEILAQKDNTAITLSGHTVQTQKTLNAGETWRVELNNVNCPSGVVYVESTTEPIATYLYTTSAGRNSYTHPTLGDYRLQGDPSSTLIPPVEHFTDSTIFYTYKNPDDDAQLVSYLNIWAKSSSINSIQMDGNSIASQFSTVASKPQYAFARFPISEGTHVVTAAEKSFTGYTYAMDAGQASLYTIGYDFTPAKDSLFLLDNDSAYVVHTSEWKVDNVSATEGGWHLDRILLDNGKYLLDSTFVCDSTQLTFPIKTYNTWEKTIWEIEGSIQGTRYFTPVEQLSSSTSRPELTHKFTLLPIEENEQPYEDFEVRAIVLRKPIICDIPEDKWERDTFNTVVRALRQYNDTTWRAICLGDTVQFFKDTVWNVNPATLTSKPVLGQDFLLQVSIFNDTTNNPSKGYYQYPLGLTSITRSYISASGCDSLSTLRLFVCSPSFEHKDTVVCQDGTRGLDYGDFFKKYKTGNTWPKKDTVMYDTLRAKGCMSTPEFKEFKIHCPRFNGCDSVLELHLNVKKVITNTYPVNQCMSQGTIYEWREKGSDRLIHTFNSDTMTLDHTYLIRDTVKYVDCVDCPEGGCDSVRNILSLQFVSDGGQKHTIHVCQGEKETYHNMNARYTFNSVGKLCNTPYTHELEVEVRGIVDGRSVVMCTFTDSLTFIVDTVYKNQMTYDTICWDPEATNQTYAWVNHPKFSAIPINRHGLITRTDTLKTYDTECDSICVLNLRVGQPYTMPTRKAICDDGSFTWQDTLFYGINYKGTIPTNGKAKPVSPGLYTSHKDTVSRYKCDSILTLSLTVHKTYIAEDKDTAVCANEPYNFYGTWYNTTSQPWVPGSINTLEIHVNSIHGCDSMVRHNVTVYPIFPNEREENDTVCKEKGAYYTWPNHPQWTGQLSLSTADSYEIVDPLTTIHGCDSIIHRTVVVLPSYDLSFRHMMSSEDTIHWEGRIYAGKDAVFDNPNNLPVQIVTGENQIVDALQTKEVGTHTCDSIRTLNLKIGKVFRDTTYDATCANCGTYEWVINSPITGKDTTIYINDLPAPYAQQYYYDSLLTELGYDSIYVRVLTTYPTYDYTDNDEVCQGEPYVWNEHMPIMVYPTGQPGSLPVEHRLFKDGQPITEIPTDQYGIIFVTDSMRTDTIFTDPRTGLVKPMHCDSVHVLTLTIHPTYNDRYVERLDPVGMSSNDTISHFDQPHVLFVGYDFDYAAANITQAELEQQYDTVVYLHATGHEVWRDSVVNTSQYGCDSVHYVDITICEIRFTQVYDSIADNDSTWFFGGETAYGAHTLPLVTGEKFHTYDDGTPVDYSQATGRTEREYLFIDTLRTTHGCDSIVHNHLRVFPAYRFEESAVICSNARYDWRDYIYLNHNKSGYVYDSVNYQVGTHTFDSVYVLDLDVVPSGYWQYDTVLCMNDTINWHHQKIYYQPGGLQYVEAIYKDANSMCGDIYHLNLQFMPFYSTTLIEHDTICQDMPYHWFTEGETNEHTENLRDGHGNKLTSIPTDVAGDFILYDSLKTYSCGCDSVYTLMLHIKPTYHTYDTTFVLCSADTLRWQDREYVFQGQQDILDTVFRTSSIGCDSIHYMKAHFDLSYDSTTTVFLCSDETHYQWEDVLFDDTLRDANTWLEPRSYHFDRSYQTALGGCDSILRLDITIAPNFDSIWTDTICRGETYNLFGQLLTEPGNYTSQQPNKWGCSTFYYLTLEQVPLPKFELQAEPICVDEDGASNIYLLHYTFESDYAPVSYNLRYDSAAHAQGFEDIEDAPIAPNELTLELPVPFFAQAADYPTPGVYQVQIAFNNGVCLSDSLMTYAFRMEMNYPSWITEQRYGDIIAILNDSLNGGYTWSAYQWYQGDSLLVGQTKPYLYMPTGLAIGEQYHVVLTREGETEGYPTCPITAVMNPNGNDYMPTMGYLSVSPTCIVSGNPTTNILSRKGGNYRITNSNGRLVSTGTFGPDVTPIQLPAVDGLYIIQLWSPDTPEEPYRAIKVLVRETCENCATSF